MFGSGNWSAYKIDVAEKDAFLASLANDALMLSVSQVTAAALTRHTTELSYGINPFETPRMDERELDGDVPAYELHNEIVRVLIHVPSEERVAALNEVLTRFPVLRTQFGSGVESFHLSESEQVPFFGFWFVENDWKDVQDLASKREQVAYEKVGVPFKFIDGKQRNAIEADVKKDAVLSRKQFPVLVDLISGVVYIENAKKTTVQSVIELLSSLGLNLIATAWEFGGDSSWAQTFLNKMREESRYKKEIAAYAEERKTFTEKEADVEEDPEIRKIVTNYFSMTELENEHWAGLSTPAKVSLHPTTESIGVSAVELTTLLLASSETASVVSASLTVQEYGSYFVKKTGEERTYRKDLLRVEISDEMNLVDAGVALLRGFDMPSFKKETKKDSGTVKVRDYWFRWLREMNTAVLYFTDAVATALELNRRDCGLKPMFSETEEKKTPFSVEVMFAE